MATLAAVSAELPATRNSFVEFPMTASIQDPTSWGALSNDGILTRHNTKSTIASEYVERSTTSKSRPSSRGHQSARAKATPAAEPLPQELEAQPLSYFPPRQSSTTTSQLESRGGQKSQTGQSNVGQETETADDRTASTGSASTAGTNSVLENQVYSLLASNTDKEKAHNSPALPSARPVVPKKASVPTSKYKKKPPPSLKSSIKYKSEAGSPLDSPVSTFTQAMHSPSTDHMDFSLPSELPASMGSPPMPASPPEAQTRQGQAPLQYAKSTASVRKARALHSHPSLPSIPHGETLSSPLLAQQPSPNLSSARGRKSMDTIRSRPSVYELQQPSPAPNTPLPDLPVGVQPLSRRGSRDTFAQPTPPPDVYVRPGTSSSTVAPTLRRQDTNPPIHAEMANYMASNSKIIFRRFHDVHIRLLLTLQDEIADLEKELAEIENTSNTSNSIDIDREARRVKVLGELRKLLAEYDHLFSNWNLMQASKADAKSREGLEQHLKQFGAGSGSSTFTGATSDLAWLQEHSGDLSYIDLTAKRNQVTVTQSEVSAEKKAPVVAEENLPARNAGSGFASLFATCAGKRK